MVKYIWTDACSQVRKVANTNEDGRADYVIKEILDFDFCYQVPAVMFIHDADNNLWTGNHNTIVPQHIIRMTGARVKEELIECNSWRARPMCHMYIAIKLRQNI